ncbi:MAG TPA: outer membrane protein [Pelagibacterium sp.]|uniref:outer membrane protein n=1 Tax=Pelagibacterium sp. TaxID=1967288 RepID=UPI002BA7EDD3|nr:outer membrane protein [Pelagibacterium sp.]HWJ87466.1 outer membrane protein [Pelagibacterium sp.]
MKTLLTVSAMTALIVATPALSADPIRPMPIPVVPVVDSSSIWDGFYAGLNVGYGWGTWSADTGAVVDTYDIEGWLGGAQVGYNFANGGMVFGVEADIQAADISGTFSNANIGDAEFGIQSFGTVRARIGADAGSFMPYITGGLAYGSLHFKLTDPAGAVVNDESQWAWGWTVGAGIEAMLADNISVKGEYLYIDLGTPTFAAGFDGSANAHTARLGVNFHF